MLKKLFWAYFLLLFFEGALRKWILPQLSAPLLLVRDPIALLIIWEAYRTHKWPKQWTTVTSLLAIGIVTLAAVQLVVGENPWFAAVYGLRTYILPFPVAFIMGENLDKDDLHKFGQWLIWAILPLTALEVAQYIAPPFSPLNIGAYEGTVQIAYAAGHVRASSTFSYVTGPMLYLPLVAAFLFYASATLGFAKQWLIWAAGAALVLAIPITGSRTVVYELAATLLCVGIGALLGVSHFGNSIKMILGVMFVAYLVSYLPIFSESMQTMNDRFSEASSYEGGTTESTFLARIVGPSVNALQSNFDDRNWLGVGLGYGASAVANLLTGSQFGLAGEDELSRILTEFGLPCGLLFAMFRWGLLLILTFKALARAREHHPLAWLLVPVMISTLGFGIMEQPTEQGFIVVVVAFILAGTNPANFPDRPPVTFHFISRSRAHA